MIIAAQARPDSDSIRLDVIPAGCPERRDQHVPIGAIRATDVAERVVDALLHALQSADVHVAVGIGDEPRDIRAAGTDAVLHVLLRRSPGPARTRN